MRSADKKHRDPDGWRKWLSLTEAANEEGLQMKAQVIGRPSGLLLGHELTLNPFVKCPTYAGLSALAFDSRIAVLKRPETRASILNEALESTSVTAPYDFADVFELGDPPDYEPTADQSIEAEAARAGVSPWALAYDILLQDGGRRLMLHAAQNYPNHSLDPSFEMMQHKDTVLGLGDGGAHHGLICDASYPTSMIAHWTRDRDRGPKMSLADVVKALCSDTAATIGLHDRGQIAVGRRADFNVIDYQRLQLCIPKAVFDLPTGGRRVVQRGHGYLATILAGSVTYRNGEPTGAMPGRVVRGARRAPSP